MKNKETIYIAGSLILLLVLAGGAYWYFLMGPVTVPTPSGTTPDSAGFQPFGRPDTPSGTGTDTGTNGGAVASSTQSSTSVLASLRLLSSTPVGGYGASTTARTTIVRWVDRGRGNVYEASYDSSSVTTLSNTVVPRIYESSWNRNLTGFISSIFEEGSASWMPVYSTLTPQSTTSAQLTPFALRGKKLPSNIIGYAVSPKKDKVAMLADDNGNGIGYVANIDGSGMTQIFTTPLTQLNIAWPSDDIITITTKSSANYSGYLYFVNPRTGVWSKVLGPIMGLGASVSHDGKYVLWSATAGNGNNLITRIYSVTQKANIDAGITTLADKCAWGKAYMAIVYCAVPSSLASGTYPDDWHTGKASAADKIWQVDASTGVVDMISTLIDQSDRIIDGFKLDLDSKDSYLFFMSKNDLSLWSLDLTNAR